MFPWLSLTPPPLYAYGLTRTVSGLDVTLRPATGELIVCLGEGGAAFGAIAEQQVIGYVLLNGVAGSTHQLLKLDSFHVSEPYRRRGIGRHLFDLACGEARRRGYRGLYISACSARETQAAYRAYGCVPAPMEEIDPASAAEEPCDIQMICLLDA